jgi:hypothetical protein
MRPRDFVGTASGHNSYVAAAAAKHFFIFAAYFGENLL